MKYGRVITAAVCAAVLLAALCGCGDTHPEVSDSTTTASTTTTTTAEETTTTTDETTADTTTATTPKSTTKKPTTTTTTKKPTTTTKAPTTATKHPVDVQTKTAPFYPIKINCGDIWGASITHTVGEGLSHNLDVDNHWFEVLLIRSVEELQRVCPEEVPKRYNTQFFKDNALVVVHQYADGYAPRMRIMDLKVMGSILGVATIQQKVTVSDDVTMPSVFLNTTITLEVKADDVKDVTNIEYFSVYDEPIPTVTVPEKELAEKEYCDASLDDDFQPGEVLIVLQHSVSMTMHYFTAEQFTEMFGIAFVEVDPLSYDNGVKTGCLTNWEHFKQIYSLKLTQNTKQAVLDAVKIIEQHPYVRAAEPNYIVYCEPCI